MRSKLLVLFYTFVCIYIVFNRQEYKSNIFVWDKSGYYIYLPATFIYHDIEHLTFSKDINRKYHTAGDVDYYAMFDQPGGKRLNKYAVGASVFQAPFFLAAHMYCLFTARFPADGYTLPYQFAGIFSNIFWVMIGLFYLRRFLLGYFTDGVTAFTLLCIAFGTNLYNYTAFDQGMSHPYSFMLFAAVLYYTDAWYRYYKPAHIYQLGIALGLVAITRPVNLLIILLPLGWGLYNKESFRERIQSFKAHGKYIVVAMILFILVSLVQMSYWKTVSGHWLCYSYHDEGFNFMRPKLWRGLFGYQKGWFVYTPIALIAMTGFLPLWKKNKSMVPVLLLFFMLLIYVVFSWQQWWYGGSFGCRALVESLAVAALPLAALIEFIYLKQHHIISKCSFTIAILFLVYVNLFQTYQYSQGIIHWYRMTQKYYWKVFLTQSPPPNAANYLMTDKEYIRETTEMHE